MYFTIARHCMDIYTMLFIIIKYLKVMTTHKYCNPNKHTTIAKLPSKNNFTHLRF